MQMEWNGNTAWMASINLISLWLLVSLNQAFCVLFVLDHLLVFVNFLLFLSWLAD